MQQAKILVDAVLVTRTQVEDVERGVEQEGKLEVGARLVGVRREEGDVERVVLMRWLAECGIREEIASTFLPMMPMQAIDGAMGVAI